MRRRRRQVQRPRAHPSSARFADTDAELITHHIARTIAVADRQTLADTHADTHSYRLTIADTHADRAAVTDAGTDRHEAREDVADHR
jgi:hypothetical protein